MKGCPRCKALVFDDMDTCFGCMYRFNLPPHNVGLVGDVPIDIGYAPAVHDEAGGGVEEYDVRLGSDDDDGHAVAANAFHDPVKQAFLSDSGTIGDQEGPCQIVGTVYPTDDSHVGGPYTLKSGDSISIGRSMKNDIVFDAPDISRRHARIEDIRGKAWIVDLESINSTKVNGVVIDDKQELFDGDVIDICGNGLVFRL